MTNFSKTETISETKTFLKDEFFSFCLFSGHRNNEEEDEEERKEGGARPREKTYNLQQTLGKKQKKRKEKTEKMKNKKD